MYSSDDLIKEINEVILSLKDNGVISARWVTQEIMNRHPTDEGHALLCQSFHTRAITGKCLAAAEKKRARRHNNEQFEFMEHGFEYLQEFYVLKRDNDEVMVALSDMTYDEILHKASQLEKEGKAKLKHSRELIAVAQLLFPEKQESL